MTDETNYGILLLFVSLLAYSMENGEPMAVKSETIEDIMKSMAANNQVPQLVIQENQDGGDYIKFGCILEKAEMTDDKGEED
jgi:hypothetical protein